MVILRGVLAGIVALVVCALIAPLLALIVFVLRLRTGPNDLLVVNLVTASKSPIFWIVELSVFAACFYRKYRTLAR
jgi:FtsH-binding integral membrane protein